MYAASPAGRRARARDGASQVTDFGGANAEVYSGISVRGGWVAAARFAIEKYQPRGASTLLWMEMIRCTRGRALTGCPDELVKMHQDVVKDENEPVDALRRVVSVVLILEGGFSISGCDV